MASWVADLNVALPGGFKGLQTGMGSWFRANNPIDSTNGNSWCGYPYKDYSPVFAPDIGIMTNGTNAVWPNPMWSTFATQYCGLEAKVYNPKTDTTVLLYVGDAFDSKWVVSPGSIDIMTKSYNTLARKAVTEKNEVMMGLQWQFTGQRNPQYMFHSLGDRYQVWL